MPKTIYGWLAVVLAIPVWAIWVDLILDRALKGEGLPGAGGVIMGVLFIGPLGVPAMLAGLYAVGIKDERSWLVWLALVPVLILVSLAVFWPLSSLLSSLLNAGAVVASILAFLILVLIVTGIAFWISRADSEEAR